MIPCMGGWCNTRDRCANYYAESKIYQPSERLCDAKMEEIEPIFMGVRSVENRALCGEREGNIHALEGYGILEMPIVTRSHAESERT